MRLRNWQQRAINAALEKFESPFSHFLCLATPGAGKTVMASALADILLKQDKIDLVLCFSPSTVVANDFRTELEAITGKRFCGRMGAIGSSLTYQSMRHLDDTFWHLLSTYRVFVIFDEIHHCSGSQIENANAWGAKILKHIQGRAIYTIALTGTPWRSDTIPIALANYVGENNQIQVDYSYDLKQAINDGVCRVPHLTLLDNELITVVEDDNKKHFNSITKFLENSTLPYSEFTSHDEVLRQILKRGIVRLNEQRLIASDAGGLIVAASISHAKKIQSLLLALGEYSEVVTYKESEPERLIQNFKRSTKKWIISIGMISEGTNIPRLRVCCYLSLVTTELYFRQVLGRVLRAQPNDTGMGYFISLAHPRLLEFASRVSEEVPHCAVIKTSETNEINSTEFPKLNMVNGTSSRGVNSHDLTTAFADKDTVENLLYNPLPRWYGSTIDSFGRFRKKVFML
ncbi:DEAD/DEAH box helicase family protein [Salinimonas marina]|uniref:DEAD/DEAH box helicase family protein n=1 Tax=Salinimonas marina TaxID=2785918 RepID=A0A7S9DZX1_9ALTE|nr:DEAD/DEAH box helicase family protein [Salinimonas marina]QPG07004.1 DEAD/DEAH box helicase family protein [Salinimonas marina]